MNRGIIPVEKSLPGRHFRPLLPELLQEDAQDLHDVGDVDLGALRNDVRVDEPATALMGPGFPFSIHCLDCFLVSGVWKDTIVSSIVTISSNIERERRWTAAKNAWQVMTCSCFCSSLRSFGTHIADFFTRPTSSLRMLKTVPMESP